MTTATEIRAWAREQGMEVPERGPLPAEIRSAFATATATTATVRPDPVVFGPAGGGPVVFAVPDPPSEDDAKEGRPAEQRPEPPPPRSPLSRAREAIAGKDRKPAPRPRAKRRTLENIGTLIWSGLARLTARPEYLPVSRMLSFQAPVAGAVFEDTVRGTVLDRALQPVARLVESGGAAGALLGPPLLAAAVCKRPELYPVARPMMAAAMKEWVIVAGPKLRAMKAREEKFAAEMATFGDEFGMTVDELLDEVFKPPEEMMQEMARAAAATTANGASPAA